MTHRTARASITLVLAAALAASAGCQSPSPAAQTEAIAPLPFGGGGGEVGMLEPVSISGQAMVGDQPMANAKVLILDAMTDAEARVIAPSGGNVVSAGGNNVVSAGGANLTTDAEGRFSVQLAGLQPGQVVRVMTTKDGQTLAALVGADGDSLDSGRQVQAVTSSIQLNFASSMLTYLASGALKMTQALKPKAAAEVVRDLFAKMRAEKPGMMAVLGNTALTARLMVAVDPSKGTITEDGARAISDMLVEGGALQAWLDLNRGTIEQILQAIQAKGNVNPDLLKALGRLQDVKLPGTGITVTLDERFLVVTNQAGKVVRVDVTDYAQLVSAAANGELRDVFDEAAKLMNQTKP
ncbi:MAG: hypothetical protein ACK46X_09100 [Candidatus Sericytochromatia bacterium]